MEHDIGESSLDFISLSEWEIALSIRDIFKFFLLRFLVRDDAANIDVRMYTNKGAETLTCALSKD